MSELGKRWAVAGVGIPVVLALLYLGGWLLAVPVAAVAALGASELYKLAAARDVPALGWLGSATAAALVLFAVRWPDFASYAAPALALLGTLVGASLVGAIALRGPERRPLGTVAVTVLGALYVGLPLAFAPLLHNLPVLGGWSGSRPDAWAGALVVALPLAATWLGDAVAFFTGSAWGKGGLAPTISPHKSWVGVWGGLAGAGLAGAVWFLVARGALPQMPVSNVVVAAGIGMSLGVGAIVGDLSESLLKREAGVKDSGVVFPGHGGVLDRLDALIVTLPATYAWLAVLDAGP